MKIKTFVYWQQWSFESNGRVAIYSSDMGGSDYLFPIGECEVEIPDITEPTENERRQFVKGALEKQKKAILAETHKKVSDIDDKIAQLLCIELKGDENVI